MSIKPWNFAPTCSKILLPGPQLLRWAVLSFPYSNSWHHKYPLVPATTRQEQTDAVPGKGRDTAGGTATPDAIPGVCSVPLLLASFRKIKLADFQVFSFYPHSPQLLSLQQALTGWNVGLSHRIYFQTAAPWAQCQTEACLSQGSWDCDLESLGCLQGPVWALLWLSDATDTRKLWSPAGTCLPPLPLSSTSSLARN